MLRNAREERRVLQQQRTGVQTRLKEVALKVEKTPRGTYQYVDLVREESKIFQEDNLIAEKIVDVEEGERQSFELLTHAIYLAHEKENEQRSREHTKYYSIIASLIGAIIGAVMAYGRLRSVNKAMESSDDTVQECRVILTDMQSQQRDMQTLITNVRQYLNTAGSSNTDQDATQQMSSVSSQKKIYDNVSVVDTEMKENIKDILTAVKENGSNLDKDVKEIRKILAVGSAKDSSGTVVYVGPEIKELLDETGKNMEFKQKIYTLTSVTLFGTLALALPMLYHFFKGY
ncbi:hypothetical protein FSP39_024356 [Pinctada imbricata]|uniref:Uncharacterized protein n=1 Tax=Pinctada imbricata TaxID=66713 RepID=A0AA88YFP1_PINIB|nr:hypothetical protein FSP39_024356 [Pinctada imbricata]